MSGGTAGLVGGGAAGQPPPQLFPTLVYALIDDGFEDEFLIGVFRTKERAEQEAHDWPGLCHIEIIELED